MRKLLIILLSILTYSVSAQVVSINNPYNGVNFSNYYKSNLHMHSTQSDGLLDPDELVERYAANDYQILAITDHDSWPNETATAATTWPWTDWLASTPTVFVINPVDANDTTSAYYPDLGSGVLAIKGNELTGCGDADNTHVNIWLGEMGFRSPDNPPGCLTTYMDSIEARGGIAQFNHAGRHNENAAGYNAYINNHPTVTSVMEIYNFGSYEPIKDTRALWDSINMTRPYDNLIFGTSGDDFHYEDTFRNYNSFYMPSLNEAAFRTAMANGAFTASYETIGSGDGLTPILTDVDVTGTIITLTVSDYDSVRWYDNTALPILTDTAIDVADYETNFVRAVLYNDDGVTHTQPFGVDVQGDYFVATDGDDGGTGAINDPWATWQYAFEQADAGDTVWFRGGTYQPTTYADGNNIHYIAPYEAPSFGNDGTASEPISYFAYPGETPILDCSLIDITGHAYNTAIQVVRANYINWRGLHITNVEQPTSGANPAMAFNGYICTNMTFEDIVIHDIGGRGFYYITDWALAIGSGGPAVTISADTTTWINCDVYNCNDSLSETPGNAADGWFIQNTGGAYFLLQGNRAYNCTDDGYNTGGAAVMRMTNNWSFINGIATSVDGVGYKFDSFDIEEESESPDRFITYNIAAYNKGNGFFDLSFQGFGMNNGRLYNNTSFKNGIGWVASDNTRPMANIYRNNIVYESTQTQVTWHYDVSITQVYTESHNIWDYNDPSPGSVPWFVLTDTVTLTDDDWLTVDSTTIVDQMKAARQSDGSLPVLTTAFVLAEGSDLIDAGTVPPDSDDIDIALPYNGDAPDIGAYESNYGVRTSDPLIGNGVFRVSNGKILHNNE